MRKLILSTLLFAGVLDGQTSPVQRVLVPIYGGAFGAFGSQWISELRVMNTGSGGAVIDNVGLGCTTNECFPDPFAPGTSIDASLSIRDVLGGTGIPGALLLVKKDVLSQFEFQLRVRDISRDAERWGVAVPVVPESLARERVDLLGVPIDSRYRQMLRVYAFDRLSGSQVRVRIYGATANPLQIPTSSDALLAETILPLQLAPTASMPSYAELSNLAQLPGVAGSPFNEIRVTAESLQPLGIWAMVSVTNNTTQEVTVIAPNVH